MINESIFYRYNSFEISNNPFLKYYKYIFPFKLQCEIKRKKKSYYFSIYNNGACIRSRMERKYYQEAWNRRKERDVGEIHRWIGTRPGPRAKKRKRRMIKFTSHLFCSFFSLVIV